MPAMASNELPVVLGRTNVMLQTVSAKSVQSKATTEASGTQATLGGRRFRPMSPCRASLFKAF